MKKLLLKHVKRALKTIHTRSIKSHSFIIDLKIIDVAGT
mgnify:CR=1 FL=1